MLTSPQQQPAHTRWTPQSAQKAEARHDYIKIGGGAGTLTLSGARHRWSKPEHADTIYISGLRMVGSIEALTAELRHLGYSEAEVESWLHSGYSRLNFAVPLAEGGLKEQYEAELASDAQYRATGGNQRDPPVPLTNLLWLDENANLAQITTSNGHTVTSMRQPVNLDQRLASLPPGYVLDVTSIQPNGTGVKQIRTPGAGSSKVGVPGLNIVSSTRAAYEQAIRLLGPQYNSYLAQYDTALTSRAPAPSFTNGQTRPVRHRSRNVAIRPKA